MTLFPSPTGDSTFDLGLFGTGHGFNTVSVEHSQTYSGWETFRMQFGTVLWQHRRRRTNWSWLGEKSSRAMHGIIFYDGATSRTAVVMRFKVRRVVLLYNTRRRCHRKTLGGIISVAVYGMRRQMKRICQKAGLQPHRHFLRRHSVSTTSHNSSTSSQYALRPVYSDTTRRRVVDTFTAWTTVTYQWT